MIHNKLVPLDKLTSRVPLSFISKEGPNENRFLNINKSPKILSTIKNVGSPDIGKYTGRKDMPVDKYRSNIYYDPNMDSVMPTISKVVPDFNRFTTRKEPGNFSFN